MLLENIKEALRNLSSNRMRSLLTMLGIIIGITAVITITTIGASIKSTLNATFNSITGKSLEVYVDAYYPETDEEWENWEYPEMDEDDYITQEMIDELVATYPEEVIGASITSWVGDGLIYESSDKYANVTLMGCTKEYIESMKLEIIRGRNLTAKDNSGKKKVCLVSDTMVSYYFGDEDPIGKQIEYASDMVSSEYTIVGVYEYDEAKFGRQDTTIPEKDRVTNMYIPVATAQGLSSDDYFSENSNGYQYVTLMLTPECDKEMARFHIEEFFYNKYASNEDWMVSVMDFSEDLSIIDTVINIITVAISFIAAISLVVGGVGVMNIMLVSITERTKEIGIRKALGAKNKTIKQQFLIESVVLCLIGGIIGILLGILFGSLLGKVAMFFINNYYEEITDIVVLKVHPSPIAIVLSVAFSMLIGIFFGSYPAKKAAKMEVIDALRYE